MVVLCTVVFISVVALHALAWWCMYICYAYVKFSDNKIKQQYCMLRKM